MVSLVLGLQDLARDAWQQVALEQEQQALAARRLRESLCALDGQLLRQFLWGYAERKEINTILEDSAGMCKRKRFVCQSRPADARRGSRSLSPDAAAAAPPAPFPPRQAQTSRTRRAPGSAKRSGRSGRDL